MLKDKNIHDSELLSNWAELKDAVIVRKIFASEVTDFSKKSKISYQTIRKIEGSPIDSNEKLPGTLSCLRYIKEVNDYTDGAKL